MCRLCCLAPQWRGLRSHCDKTFRRTAGGARRECSPIGRRSECFILRFECDPPLLFHLDWLPWCKPVRRSSAAGAARPAIREGLDSPSRASFARADRPSASEQALWPFSFLRLPEYLQGVQRCSCRSILAVCEMVRTLVLLLS